MVNKDKQIINKFNIEKLYPLYCTGNFAISEMFAEFNGKVLLTAAGKKILIPVAK